MRTGRFILCSTAAMLLLGGTGAMLLAMAGPRYLPARVVCWYAPGLNGKLTCWCFDYYDVDPTLPIQSGPRAAEDARKIEFTDDIRLAGRHSGRWAGLGQVYVIDSGFPLRCTTAWRCGPPMIPANQGDPPLLPEGGFIELAARNPLDGPLQRWIPYHPLWPGLIGNALVWGGALWVMLFEFRFVRHVRRQRRGLSPAAATTARASRPARRARNAGRLQ